MSVSAVAPSLPMYSDPERLVPMLPSERADTAAAATAERGDGKHLAMFGAGDDEPSFWDLLDVINPLQHIPVVSTIYQELTGDKIGVGARLAGGALFGGPIGLIASAVNCAIEEDSGADVGGHLLAMFRDDPAAPATALAQAQPAKASQAKPVELAMAAAPSVPATAPIITVPDLPAAPMQRGAMMFTSDGTLANPPPVPAPTPVASAPIAAPPVAQPVSAHTGHMTGKPLPLSGGQAMPLSGAPRFMPVPQRTVVSGGVNGPAPVTVPVSNSGNRSNVPITGRDPLAYGSPNAVAVQKAVAAQGLGGAAPPTDASKSGGNADWFSAMNQALDKYDRAGSLAARPGPSTVTLQ